MQMPILPRSGVGASCSDRGPTGNERPVICETHRRKPGSCPRKYCPLAHGVQETTERNKTTKLGLGSFKNGAAAALRHLRNQAAAFGGGPGVLRSQGGKFWASGVVEDEDMISPRQILLCCLSHPPAGAAGRGDDRSRARGGGSRKDTEEVAMAAAQKVALPRLYTVDDEADRFMVQRWAEKRRQGKERSIQDKESGTHRARPQFEKRLLSCGVPPGYVPPDSSRQTRTAPNRHYAPCVPAHQQDRNMEFKLRQQQRQSAYVPKQQSSLPDGPLPHRIPSQENERAKGETRGPAQDNNLRGAPSQQTMNSSSSSRRNDSSRRNRGESRRSTNAHTNKEGVHQQGEASLQKQKHQDQQVPSPTTIEDPDVPSVNVPPVSGSSTNGVTQEADPPQQPAPSLSPSPRPSSTLNGPSPAGVPPARASSPPLRPEGANAPASASAPAFPSPLLQEASVSVFLPSSPIPPPAAVPPHTEAAATSRAASVVEREAAAPGGTAAENEGQREVAPVVPTATVSLHSDVSEGRGQALQEGGEGVGTGMEGTLRDLGGQGQCPAASAATGAGQRPPRPLPLPLVLRPVPGKQQKREERGLHEPPPLLQRPPVRLPLNSVRGGRRGALPDDVPDNRRMSRGSGSHCEEEREASRAMQTRLPVRGRQETDKDKEMVDSSFRSHAENASTYAGTGSGGGFSCISGGCSWQGGDAESLSTGDFFRGHRGSGSVGGSEALTSSSHRGDIPGDLHGSSPAVGVHGFGVGGGDSSCPGHTGGGGGMDPFCFTVRQMQAVCGNPQNPQPTSTQREAPFHDPRHQSRQPLHSHNHPQQQQQQQQHQELRGRRRRNPPGIRNVPHRPRPVFVPTDGTCTPERPPRQQCDYAPAALPLRMNGQDLLEACRQMQQQQQYQHQSDPSSHQPVGLDGPQVHAPSPQHGTVGGSTTPPQQEQSALDLGALPADSTVAPPAQQPPFFPTPIEEGGVGVPIGMPFPHSAEVAMMAGQQGCQNPPPPATLTFPHGGLFVPNPFGSQQQPMHRSLVPHPFLQWNNAHVAAAAAGEASSSGGISPPPVSPFNEQQQLVQHQFSVANCLPFNHPCGPYAELANHPCGPYAENHARLYPAFLNPMLCLLQSNGAGTGIAQAPPPVESIHQMQQQQQTGAAGPNAAETSAVLNGNRRGAGGANRVVNVPFVPPQTQTQESTHQLQRQGQAQASAAAGGQAEESFNPQQPVSPSPHFPPVVPLKSQNLINILCQPPNPNPSPTLTDQTEAQQGRDSRNRDSVSPAGNGHESSKRQEQSNSQWMMLAPSQPQFRVAVHPEVEHGERGRNWNQGRAFQPHNGMHPYRQAFPHPQQQQMQMAVREDHADSSTFPLHRNALPQQQQHQPHLQQVIGPCGAIVVSASLSCYSPVPPTVTVGGRGSGSARSQVSRHDAILQQQPQQHGSSAVRIEAGGVEEVRTEVFRGGRGREVSARSSPETETEAASSMLSRGSTQQMQPASVGRVSSPEPGCLFSVVFDFPVQDGALVARVAESLTRLVGVDAVSLLQLDSSSSSGTRSSFRSGQGKALSRTVEVRISPPLLDVLVDSQKQEGEGGGFRTKVTAELDSSVSPCAYSGVTAGVCMNWGSAEKGGDGRAEELLKYYDHLERRDAAAGVVCVSARDAAVRLACGWAGDPCEEGQHSVLLLQGLAGLLVALLRFLVEMQARNIFLAPLPRRPTFVLVDSEGGEEGRRTETETGSGEKQRGCGPVGEGAGLSLRFDPYTAAAATVDLWTIETAAGSSCSSLSSSSSGSSSSMLGLGRGDSVAVSEETLQTGVRCLKARLGFPPCVTMDRGGSRITRSADKTSITRPPTTSKETQGGFAGCEWWSPSVKARARQLLLHLEGEITPSSAAIRREGETTVRGTGRPKEGDRRARPSSPSSTGSAEERCHLLYRRFDTWACVGLCQDVFFGLCDQPKKSKRDCRGEAGAEARRTVDQLIDAVTKLDVESGEGAGENM
uniref:Uncharacterized protein n=1 Tax=Chromera velia CCMP2878 TaxID=1169474 RepID=A0A0G4G0C8_9ALVE|eukprot:Cvel_526.t1-p1 / transcript=Cvel_526.t1 / gene=Cvel_526 / organism=Chromera_velia_CCMP2878 / gene_product=hypothetical protein / transcript_product=hypothetical protein / location=Cvel_scaffold16:116859-124908(+) / protein_length=1979 / sequence_SO=supercontig / SO=protein_coding / is_pseudo=false